MYFFFVTRMSGCSLENIIEPRQFYDWYIARIRVFGGNAPIQLWCMEGLSINQDLDVMNVPSGSSVEFSYFFQKIKSDGITYSKWEL